VSTGADLEGMGLEAELNEGSMSDSAANAAKKARQILGSAGIRHTIGTTSDDNGPLVVVDVPYEVDRQSVRDKLHALDANVLVRHVRRSIIGQ
jgi:hypothetical protein